MRQQGGVPVAIVGLVVADGEGLGGLDAGGGELCAEVVLRAEQAGVLEVDWHRVAAQDLRRPPCPPGALLLHHHLVQTAEEEEEKEEGPHG